MSGKTENLSSNLKKTQERILKNTLSGSTFHEGVINIASNDNKIRYESRRDDNPRYYAKRAGYILYDLIGEFEEDLDDKKVEEIEHLISAINSL